MLGYLQKFNSLPQELKNKISSPQAMQTIDQLEKKYQVDLAILIMRVMVKEMATNEVASFLEKDFGMDKIKAGVLAGELDKEIFSLVGPYLGKPAEISENSKIGKAASFDVVKNQSADPSSAKGAAFFFSPEDEQEIRELSKKIINEKSPEELLEQKLAYIINTAKINFGSESLDARFRQIIKTYLKGIRNRIEAKQSLSKPVEAGGINFDENQVDKILGIIDNLPKDLGQVKIAPKPPLIKTPEIEREALASLKKIGARDFEYDLASSLKKRQEEKKMEKLDTSHELMPPPPAIIPKQKVKAAAIKKPQVKETIRPTIVESIPILRRPAENIRKPRLDDVKFVPRVMGPIDELKYLDLTNFRRLDNDPVKATEKIKKKISLLEEENYAKRLEGIKAWRISPINKIYLQMGHDSISENKPINVIIEERKQKKSDCLEYAEFEAIMDMNKELRF